MDTATTVTISANGDFPGIFWNGKWFPIIAGGSDQSGSDKADASTEGENSDGTSTETEGDKDGEKKFTQDEVNAIIAREVSKKTRGKLDPSELGFKSRQELEDAIKAAKEADEASKTEQEKALEAARKEAADEARASVLTKAQEVMLKADFKVKASEAGVAPNALEDAFAVAKLTGAWKDDVSIDDDGNVSGLDDSFFKKFKEAKPFFFGEPKAGGVQDVAGGARSDNGALSGEADLRKKYSALGPGG